MSDITTALVDGPDRYWSTELAPSRGQLASIATLGLELLGLQFPANRFEATVAITRLRAAVLAGVHHELEGGVLDPEPF